MRNLKNIYMAALLMMAISACSVEKEQPLETEDGSQSFTITANIPTEIWGEVTRSYTDEPGVFYLRYIDYKGEKVVYPMPSGNFNTSSTAITFNQDKNLVWERIQNDENKAEMHLTVINNDLGYHLHAAVVADYGAESITFDLKPSMAKLTIDLIVNDNDKSLTENFFYAKISGKEASDSYDPWINEGVWPVSDSDLEPMKLKSDYYLGGYSCENLLPEQTLGNQLTLTYGSYEWYLDLSKVTVTGGKEGQMANQVYAGQNLTLSLHAYLTDLKSPAIEVTAFVEDSKEVIGTAEAGYTYDEDTKTYTVHNEYGVLAWLNAYLADTTVKLEAYEHFDLSNLDLEIPRSFLSSIYNDFIVEDGVLKLAGRQWKSISILDENGTDVLGRYGITNGYPTMTIGENPYYVTSANLERTAEVFTATCTSLRNVIGSGITRLYIVDEMTSIYEDAEKSYPSSMIGGSIWYVYQNSSYSFPSLSEIILADATTVIYRGFLLLYHVPIFNAPKVTVVQGSGFEDASVGTFMFGSVLTDIGTNAFIYSQSGSSTDRTSSSLVLCEDQKNSESLKPDAEARTWAGYTWNNISFQ